MFAAAKTVILRRSNVPVEKPIVVGTTVSNINVEKSRLPALKLPKFIQFDG